MKIIDYKLVQESPGAFNREIRSLINEGWQPHGSPYYDSNGSYHCQAMVRYEHTSGGSSTGSTGPR